MTNNFDTGNNKIVYLKKRTQANDAVNLNQLNSSHISSHTDRTNVLKYIKDNPGEFTADYGISSVNLIDDFDDMLHKIRKKSIFF